MKVYSAGFYVDDYTLKRLPSLPGWAGYEPAALQGPEAETMVQAVLDAPAACAVNVSECRQLNSTLPCQLPCLLPIAGHQLLGAGSQLAGCQAHHSWRLYCPPLPHPRAPFQPPPPPPTLVHTPLLTCAVWAHCARMRAPSLRLHPCSRSQSPSATPTLGTSVTASPALSSGGRRWRGTVAS
jgi:hypothetical protein